MIASQRRAAATAGLKWSGWTDRGKVKPNNEDAFLGLRFDAREVHHLGKIGEASMRHYDFAFAVSDGIGGARAGEFASRIAVDKTAALLPRAYRDTAIGLESGFEDVLTELFDQIHRTLTFVGSAYEECSNMETTLSLCWFTPGWAYIGHIGDSRVYYLPAGDDRIRQVTQDDTHVGWLLRNGKINEREARCHPRRNSLQKALGGTNQFVDPQLGAIAYEPGDIFLLCSDGLVDGLYDHHLTEHLRRLDPAPDANPARQLTLGAVEKDGSDNVTAVVVQVV